MSTLASTGAWVLAVTGGLTALFFAVLHYSFRAPRRIAETAPADLGLPSETVALTTTRGKRLFAWFIPPPPGARPAPAVAIIHGWGANAGVMLPLAAPLHAAGFAVLLVEARNHGRSDGDGHSSMPKFAEDLSHAVDALKVRPEVDPARVAVMGHSVGAAAALLCAARRDDVAACVSLAAFAHPEDIMRRIMNRVGVPYMPVGWVVNRAVEAVIGHRFAAIAPVATIGRVHCPVLIGHGLDDEAVPVTDARAIHACSRREHCDLVELPAVNHGADGAMEQVAAPVVAFLNRVLNH